MTLGSWTPWYGICLVLLPSLLLSAFQSSQMLALPIQYILGPDILPEHVLDSVESFNSCLVTARC